MQKKNFNQYCCDTVLNIILKKKLNDCIEQIKFCILYLNHDERHCISV